MFHVVFGFNSSDFNSTSMFFSIYLYYMRDSNCSIVSRENMFRRTHLNSLARMSSLRTGFSHYSIWRREASRPFKFLQWSPCLRSFWVLYQKLNQRQSMAIRILRPRSFLTNTLKLWVRLCIFASGCTYLFKNLAFCFKRKITLNVWAIYSIDKKCFSKFVEN